MSRSPEQHRFGPADSDLDRRAERRDDLDWLAQQWASGTAVVIRVGVDGIGVTGEPPTLLDRPRDGEPLPQIFLGIDGLGVAHFASMATPDSDPTEHESAIEPAASVRNLRLILGELPVEQARIAAYAMALTQWHARHPRCARCGAATLIAQAGHVRRCPDCGADHYPRTDPAVIVLVTDTHDRALLGRQVAWPERRFSTLAGFVEPGESLEAAVAREVFEESGVRVHRADYVASQPWPFPASLMLGFVADAEDQPAQADGVEMAEVRWFTREELADAIASGEVLLPPPTSISRSLIDTWLLRATSA